jgi:hypothetical protein
MKLVKFLFFKASHCGRTTRTNRARQPKPSRFVPKPHKFLVEPLTSRVLLSVAFMHPAMGGMARGLLLRLKTTELFCQPLPVPQPSAPRPPTVRRCAALGPCMAGHGVAEAVLQLAAACWAGQTR